MAKKPSKKQLAARKKFTAMVKRRAKEKKKAKIGLLPMVAKYAAGKMLKRKAGIGDTLVRIPSNTRKTKRVTLQRGAAGRFDVLSGDMYSVRDKLEREIKNVLGAIEVNKHLQSGTKDKKIKKQLSTRCKAMRKVLAPLRKQLAAQNRLINSNLK